MEDEFFDLKYGSLFSGEIWKVWIFRDVVFLIFWIIDDVVSTVCIFGWWKEKETESLKREHLDTHTAGRFFEVVFTLWVVFIPSRTALLGFFP